MWIFVCFTGQNYSRRRSGVMCEHPFTLDRAIHALTNNYWQQFIRKAVQEELKKENFEGKASGD